MALEKPHRSCHDQTHIHHIKRVMSTHWKLQHLHIGEKEDLGEKGLCLRQDVKAQQPQS